MKTFSELRTEAAEAITLSRDRAGRMAMANAVHAAAFDAAMAKLNADLAAMEAAIDDLTGDQHG